MSLVAGVQESTSGLLVNIMVEFVFVLFKADVTQFTTSSFVAHPDWNPSYALLNHLLL